MDNDGPPQDRFRYCGDKGMYPRIAGSTGAEICDQGGIYAHQEFGLRRSGYNPNRYLAFLTESITGDQHKIMFTRNTYIPYTMLIMMSATLLLLAYWLFWPIDVFEVTGSRFLDTKHHVNRIVNGKSVDLPVFNPGDTVSVAFNYNKYYALKGDLSRILLKEDKPHKGMAVTVIASNRHGNLPVGTCLENIMSFIIPITTPPGVYRVYTSIVYRVNPVRDFYEEWYSPELIVVRNGK